MLNTIKMTHNKLTLDTKFISIKNIYDSLLRENKINYRTEYQRDMTWSDDQNSLFIDTLINGYIVPSIVLLKSENEQNDYEFDCVDGQHRLTCIKKFIEGKITHKIKINNTHSYINICYQNNLAEPEQNTITKYLSKKEKQTFDNIKIPIFKIINNVDKQTIRDIFCRLQNGVKISRFGKLKNQRHTFINFIRDNHVLDCFEIKSLAKIIFYSPKLTDDEAHDTNGKLCEKKQKNVFFIMTRMMYIYKNKHIKDFTLGTINHENNIYNYLPNNSKHMTIDNGTLIDFYAKFRSFISYLNYTGVIIYKEYMLLILWKYYLDNNNNNIHKFNCNVTINKYNNDTEFTKQKPDNGLIDNIYKKFTQNEIDLLQ